jgi:hypothetical protein
MKVLFGLLLMPFCLQAQVSFVDVADSLNITWSGKTFGTSWSDVSGNGFPDLFLQCHSNFFDAYFDDDLPRYYFNQGDSFTEGPTLEAVAETDWHGGMMFDFDNDGDLDHLSVTGGSSANILFENENGSFSYQNSAASVGLDCEGCVGRSPAVIDVDNDGFLDVLLSNLAESQGGVGSVLLINDANQIFTDQTSEYNLDWSASFSVTSDLIGDGAMNVIYLADRPTITTLIEGGFQTEFDLPVSNTYDFAIDDFNGDLLPDIFCATGRKSAAVDQVSSDIIRAHIPFSANDDIIQINISTNDLSPQLTIFPRNISTPYVVISGNNTSQVFNGEETQLDLNQLSAVYTGIPTIEDTISMPHVYVGYDEDESYWSVRFKSGFNTSIPLALEFNGEQSEVINFTGIEISDDLNDRLFINEGDLEFNQVLANLFDGSDNSLSVTTADFDNDMDIDIYVVRSSFAGNAQNILYENNNLGFVRHEGAWGATGDGPGIGDAVNSVDYNNDGFMDIFVTNGASVFFLDSAGVNLYQNQGNNNNWIKIILSGITSNPLGMHAKAYVYSGGTAQMKYQDGGFHRYSQDDNRLHFGLAQNNTIDSIVIDWPSGIHQLLTEIDVNQILTIVEDFDLSTDPAYLNSPFFKIFPNPTSGKITVSSSSIIHRINVYSSLGVLVQYEDFSGRNNTEKINLQASPGIYRIEGICEKGIFRENILIL